MSNKVNEELLNEKPVMVLQNITIKSSNSENVLSSPTRTSFMPGNYKEINKNKNRSLQQRLTASSYIFDELPIFSDSDEENQYSFQILSSQAHLHQENETLSRSRVKTRSNSFSEHISQDEWKIMDIIEKCASTKTENLKEDFKQFVQMCNQLRIKYKNYYYIGPTSSERVNISTGNELGEIGNSMGPNQSEKLKSLSNDLFQKRLLPSRNGSSHKNAFSSHVIISDGGSSNSSFISNYQSSRENKNTLRSDKIRKTAPLKSGNPKKNGCSPQAIGSDRGISNSSDQSTKENEDTLRSGEIGETAPKSAEIFVTGKNMNQRTKKQLRINFKKVDMFNVKNVVKNSNMVSAKSTKRTRYSQNVTSNKLSQEKPEKGRIKDFDDCWIDLKIIPLSKKETRTLARSWMKPNKNNFKDFEMLGTTAPVKEQKTRRLYSPEEWLHSEQFPICISK